MNTQLGAVEDRLTPIEQQLDQTNTQLGAVEDRLATIEEQLDTALTATPEPEGAVIPQWQPGTSASEAEQMLKDCYSARFAKVTGPLGEAMAPFAASFLDLDDLLEDTDSEGVFGNQAFFVWMLGTLLGCWTGELNG